MKIFFCKKTGIYPYIKENFLNLILVFLVVTLVIAQSVSFFKRSGAKETAATVEAASSKIYLRITRGEYDGVKVLINGEEGAVFKGGELSLSLEEDSVIEIYNPRDKIVAVQVTPGYGTEFVAGAQKKVCYEGITYIGKLIIEN